MSDIIFQAHSGIRYLVLLTGVIALLYMLVNLFRSRPWSRTAQILFGTFIGVLDLQVLLGVILVIVWPFYPALIGHIVLMLLAVSVAHGASVVGRRRGAHADGQVMGRQRYAIALIGIAGALLLILAGIMAIQRSII